MFVCCKENKTTNNAQFDSDSKLTLSATEKEKATDVFDRYMLIKLDLEKKSIELLKEKNVDIDSYKNAHVVSSEKLKNLTQVMQDFKLSRSDKDDIKALVDKHKDEFENLIKIHQELTSESGIESELGEANLPYKRYCLDVENPFFSQFFGDASAGK